MRLRPCDPVGTIEIATRLGVRRSTVDMWRQRDLHFPKPTWTIGGRPAWNWDVVWAWAERTGRDPITTRHAPRQDR